MTETGQILGGMNAVVTAIADTFYEMGGFVLTRCADAGGEGDSSLVVESGFLGADGAPGFPEHNGRVACLGTIFRYTTATATVFSGITDDDGNAGLPIAVPERTALMDISRQTTQLDLLRASFLLDTVDSGDQLDMFARNYGLTRPRGLDGETFRALIRVMIYLEAGTIYGMEQVLTVLVGEDGYTIYEDLMSDMYKVFVLLDPEEGGPAGRSYFAGGEAHARSTNTTVIVTLTPLLVYGVYDAADPFRAGTNYAMASFSATTASANPTRLTAAALFLAGDVGKPVIFAGLLGTECWEVATFISTSAITLVGRTHTNARLDGAFPTHVYLDDRCDIAEWVVGHKFTIVGGANAGSYEITSWVSRTEIVVSGATFVDEEDATWHLTPDFGNGTGTTKVLRATFVGTTITTPVTMPVNVLVDYTAIESMQLMENPAVAGISEGASPFFLFQEGYIVQTVLDLITVAGVEAVVGVR